MSALIIAFIAFVGVAALVGGVAVLLHEKPFAKIEDRLDLIAGGNGSSASREKLAKQGGLLNQPLVDSHGYFEELFSRLANFELLFAQADTSLTLSRFLMISGVLGVVGFAAGVVMGINLLLAPLLTIVMAALPLIWLVWRKKKRMKNFAVQLPDALEMLARALRAGQSLGAGFNAIAQEMSAPISIEFGRVFEEQNLGIPLEESLNDLGDRIPNLDLKFFCTAVILQRQTGGDLAEILDKIGSLIRERFQIWGQVQALTGEGRMSGIVLLALPVFLFVVVYQMNPDYIMLLFTDPMGKKMMATAIVMQILGALVIRKIVDIKV